MLKLLQIYFLKKNSQEVQGILMSQQVQQGPEVPCLQAFHSCQVLPVCQEDPPLPSLLELREGRVVPGVHWDLKVSVSKRCFILVKTLYQEVLLSQLALHLLSLLGGQEHL